MKPVITVEFSAKAGDEEFKEESVPLHSPEELFAFVAPNGGCESIPDEVVEIKMIFLPPQHPNTRNPIADLKKYHTRVFDVHIKDVSAPEKEGRTVEIGRGVIDSRDVIYYVSVVVFFLYLNVRTVESRKWK